MEIKEKRIKGVFEIILEPHLDERGFFMRTFDKNVFKKAGIDFEWVQENHSRSEKKGIIRGLHFQIPPFCETKLVRCIAGKILDVFVDIRYDSPTFGQWDCIELSAENKRIILIPREFAHGYCTLTNISEVVYKVDNFYSPTHEKGIIWNDIDLGIKWPVTNPLLSAKDQQNMTLKQFMKQFKAI